MKKITLLLILSGLASFLFYSCSSEFKGYEKTKSGLYYKFHIQTDSTRVKIGDEVTFHLKYTLNDSVIFDSNKKPSSKLILPEKQYAGDIYDCFALMAIGDSASFIIEADSFFRITLNQPRIPSYIKPNSKLHADVKILSLKSKEDIELENTKRLEELEEKEIKLTEKFKVEQKTDKEFIKNTGIFYKENKKGSGRLPNPTDFITVEYEIQDLNGDIFFTSKNNKEEMLFECLGENFETEGFNLVISKMCKGQKAGFLIPSNLAFGEEGIPGRIQPFTPLYYTIEILNIQKKEDYLMEKESKNRSLINAENEKIASYLKENAINAPPRKSGLYYIEKVEGSGQMVKSGDKVKVHYTLFNLDGKKIDSSIDRGSPFIFVVGKKQVIAGWDEALTLMKKGGKATLILPSKIAYGDKKRSEDIPPYTPLLFEVELIEIME